MIEGCLGKITEQQISTVRPFKLNPERFDIRQQEYNQLVKPTFATYDLKTFDSEADGYQIEFTNQENAILSQVEDVSDSIQKAERANKKGSVDIAFFDLSEMSPATQLLYIGGAIGSLVILMYYFYTKMVAGPEEEERQRLAMKESRRAKKSKKN